MAEIADVLAGAPVEADWGNLIRDRTLQRYANAAARSSSVPSPVEGDFSYLLDTDSVEFFDGTGWVSTGITEAEVQALIDATVAGYLALAGGSMDLGAEIAQVFKLLMMNTFGDPSGFIEAFPSSGRQILRIGAGTDSGVAGQPFLQMISAEDGAAPEVNFRFGGSSTMRVVENQALFPDGTIAAPGIGFAATSGAGLFRNAQARIQSVGDMSLGDKRLYMTSPDGVSNGYYFFANVSDGADFGFAIRAIDDTEILQLRSNGQTFIKGAYDTTTGDSANMSVASDGLLRRSTSAKRYKKSIKKLWRRRPEAERYLDMELNPVEFIHKGDKKRYLGFIAEEVAAIDGDLGVFNAEGEVESYDLRGVVAILAAQVNELRAEVAKLKG